MADNSRIVIVDALRGFALLMIVMIHYVEHFDFFTPPLANSLLVTSIDKTVMEYTFFLISGKAYSIFALLFGFSFFIQMHRAEEAGKDFRARFLWRLCILMIFGFLHSLVYRGDILHIYALLGTILLILYKVNHKALFILAILFALQIPTIYNVIQSFTNPDFAYSASWGQNYWGEGNIAYQNGSFTDVIAYNLWKGRAAVWGWTYYYGRYMQLLALFITGLLIGRSNYFVEVTRHKKLTVIVLFSSFIIAIILYAVLSFIPELGFSQTQQGLTTTLFSSYFNLAVTSSICSLLVLIYLNFRYSFFFRLLSSYGKMSLTNYILQSITGVVLFYGFGFALYKYFGALWSLLLGITVFLISALLSKQWLKKYRYGPLEWMWRASTFLNFRINIRRGKN